MKGNERERGQIGFEEKFGKLNPMAPVEIYCFESFSSTLT